MRRRSECGLRASYTHDACFAPRRGRSGCMLLGVYRTYRKRLANLGARIVQANRRLNRWLYTWSLSTACQAAPGPLPPPRPNDRWSLLHSQKKIGLGHRGDASVCVEARTVLSVPAACMQRGPSEYATAARSSRCQYTKTTPYSSYKNMYTS